MVEPGQKLFCTNCQHFHNYYKPSNSYICSESMCFCERFESQGINKADYDKIKLELDTIKQKITWILENIPEMRELNNKQFVFAYWHYEFNFCPGMILDVKTYYHLTDPETIRRVKQKIVENHPSYGPTNDEFIIQKGIKKGAIEEWIIEN